MIAVSRISSVDCLTDKSSKDVLIRIGVFDDVGLTNGEATRRYRSDVLVPRTVGRGRAIDIFSEFYSLY